MDKLLGLLQENARLSCDQLAVMLGTTPEEVEKQIPQSAERDELVKFIRESKRGIIKPYESKSKEE